MNNRLWRVLKMLANGYYPSWHHGGFMVGNSEEGPWPKLKRQWRKMTRRSSKRGSL